MNQNIVIKSFTNGLKIYINDDRNFNEVLAEIESKLKAAAGFFKNSKLAVSFEGRNLSDEEERQVVSVMEKTCNMTVLYIMGKDDETHEIYKKAYDKPYFEDETDGKRIKIYKGTIKKGERLEFSSGVLIVGDIEPGALVKAPDDVIVLGGLYGNVTIEDENSTNHFIFANEMSPERIIICGLRYYQTDKPRWSIRPKYLPKVAFIKDNKVVMENSDRNILNGFKD